MHRDHILCRILILLIGLSIMSLGIAISIKSALGTSPISSLPYVASELSGLTVGQATIALHCTLVTLQILMLRRRYQPIQLLQLAVAVVFGYMNDAAVALTAGLSVQSYPAQWAMGLAGTLLVGIGVACEVLADLVMLAGEGTVKAATIVSGQPFPRLKVMFDCTLVGISILLSVIFLHRLAGVREGTIAAALLVGPISKVVLRLLRPITNRIGITE